ncbi:MAG: diacylglycerol kinase [Pseudomonadota bacterium]
MNSKEHSWKNTGFRRLWFALLYSCKGLSAAWKNEAAFRQELLALIIVVPIGWSVGENGVEKALLIGVAIVVPIVELLNSAIEAVVDRFGPEHHELSGRAKDIGSAAVLVSIGLAVVVWVLVLFA